MQEIQTAAEAKKRQIEASKAFTQEEKNEAIQKINQAVQDAQAKRVRLTIDLDKKERG